MAQKDKKFSLLHSISQELYIIWLSFLVHIFKMIISPCILIFEVVRGLKGEKMAQNDQKFYLLHSIPQELYIVWSSFMVHVCKMIIFPGMLFHFFKILITWVVRGLKGWLMVQNDKNFCPLYSISQEPYIIWLSFMVYMCKMIIFAGIFSFSSKFWFSGLLRG